MRKMLVNTHSSASRHLVVRIPSPHTHRVHLEITVEHAPGDSVTWQMPRWIPGAYKLVDFARNLRNVRAETLEGTPLPVIRLDLHTWRLDHGGQPFRWHHEAHLDQMTVHQAQVTADHGLINPATLCPRALEWADEPCTVRFELPPTWRVATALREMSPGLFLAEDYDRLIDCPWMLGAFHDWSFRSDDLEARVAWSGTLDPQAIPALSGGLDRIFSVTRDFWGQRPYDRYLFQYQITDDDFINGLEHADSTFILGNLDPVRRLRPLLSLTLHEVFHTWNVKRLRPVGFGPFDYGRPAHTPSLWLVEGATEYCTGWLMNRSGLAAPGDWLTEIGGWLDELERMPGRLDTTLAESSFITWNFMDDRWNGAVNYYVKGALMAMALDLELRTRTGNRVSLQTWMRTLWERFAERGLPYAPGEPEAIASELSGSNLDSFFALHLHTTQDADWQAVLGQAGLKLEKTSSRADLGARTTAKDGGLSLEGIRHLGAAQRAGLQRGDRLLSWEGRRLTAAGLQTRLEEAHPGDEVELRFFRGDRLLETRLVLDGTPAHRIEMDVMASREATATRTDWMATLQADLAKA